MQHFLSHTCLQHYTEWPSLGHYYSHGQSDAAFRLACRSPHCRFDGDICSTAQAPLATEGRPSGKQREANQLISSPLCSQRQIADS